MLEERKIPDKLMKLINKILATEMKFLRKVRGVTLMDRLSNTGIRKD